MITSNNQYIIDNINYYKNRTADSLRSQQIAYIPHIEEDQIECMVSTYCIGNKRILIDQTKQLCFRLKHIKTKSTPYRKADTYFDKTTGMIELVDSNIIYPFILFINGIFIPWECISISLSTISTHLIVDRTKVTPALQQFDVKFAQIVALPPVYEYCKSSPSKEIVFSFDSNGQYTSDLSSKYYISKPIDSNVQILHAFTENSVNALSILDSQSAYDSVRLFSDNVILFVNGFFSTGTKENIKKSMDLDFSDDDFTDYAPKLDIVEDATELEPNPEIRIDSSFLTIDGGQNINSDMYGIVISFYTDCSRSIDNSTNVTKSQIQQMVIDSNAGATTYLSNVYEDLFKNFNQVMDRDKSYSDNLSEFITSMIKYNSSSFKGALKDSAPISFTERTGEWVLANTNSEDGILWLPRSHNNNYEEYIIMLVNGELYNYDHMIKYRANFCAIPIDGIVYTDKIEFIRFSNVNNNVFDIVITEDEGYIHYGGVISSDMVLFSDEASPSAYYTFPTDGQQHFIVDYTITTNTAGMMKIELTDDYYYGKNLKICYRNRYVHKQYIIPASEDYQYRISLGSTFKYCNDYSKYIIFHNGRKLNSDSYRLTIPARTTTPFSEFYLYITIPIAEGDKLDIIYSPTIFKDIVYKQTIETNGSIAISKDSIGYAISGDLYMIWLNGKKLPASCIQDIDSTRICITSNETSIKNLCITQYIPNMTELVDSFAQYTSDWDTLTSDIPDDKIDNFLGFTFGDLTNAESDILIGAVPIRSMMYELIRDNYITNSNVDITKPLVYDYLDVDTSVIETSGEQILIAGADSNYQDNIDDIERIWE